MAGLGDLYKTLFGGGEPPPKYRKVGPAPPMPLSAPYSRTGLLENIGSSAARRAELREKYGDDFRHTGPLQDDPIFEVPVSLRTHEHPGFRAMSKRLSVYSDPESTEGIPLARFGASILDQQLRRWNTSLNVAGQYFHTAQDPPTGDLEKKMWEDMRLDPAEAAGVIAVGPEVDYGDYGRSAQTIEHELMHKAIEELFPDLGEKDQNFINKYGEEAIVRRLIDENLGLETYEDAPKSTKRRYPKGFALSRLDGVISRLNKLATSTLSAKQKASGGIVIDDGNPAKRRKLI